MSPRQPAGNRPSQAILTVANLRKSYRGGFWGRRGAPAVDALSLEVRRGEVFALLGHNGAGKTTTLKAILGLIRPDAGRIVIAGVDARDPAARARVGYLPEAPYFHENLSAAELLDFYGKLLGLSRARRRERAEACLEQVGMAGEAGRRLRHCSKGMRQRIGLAQALLGEPDLLILDEPQSGLDPIGRREVRDLLLAQKRRGVTIVFSSHIVPEVEAVADRVAVLRGGRLAEIKDLGERPPARTFRVVIGAPPGGGQVAGVLAEAALTVTDRGPDRWRLDVLGAGPLGRLLCACEADGVMVREVQSSGGDLETEFLAGLGAAPRMEVSSC